MPNLQSGLSSTPRAPRWLVRGTWMTWQNTMMAFGKQQWTPNYLYMYQASTCVLPPNVCLVSPAQPPPQPARQHAGDDLCASWSSGTLVVTP